MPLQRTILFALGGLWIAATAIGTAALWQYAYRPGATGTVFPAWPADFSRNALAADRYTLLVFLHGECPCSRATVRELGRVMAQADRPLSVRAYMRDPHDTTGQPSSLWRAAGDIPGVQLLADPQGAVARTFGAETSGATFLFDPAGELLFSGGITGARGHEGKNANQDALLACLRERPESSIRANTYGCSLF